jgi:hypothetical protein
MTSGRFLCLAISVLSVNEEKFLFCIRMKTGQQVGPLALVQ